MAAVSYLQGDEQPTAALMNDLFGALDAKLTLMLGGRSFFMAQTATPPQYLVGKTFFFTTGPATYATRVPGYINIGTGGASVARPYNHAQFTGSITPISVIQVATVSVASGGSNYHVGDIIPVPGGTLYAVSASVGATLKVTSVNSGGGITGLGIVNPGFYKTSPGAQVGYYNNYPQHLDVYINLTYTTTVGFYDETNKVAYVMPVSTSAYSGLPTENLVGFFEWSLAAHSILRQGPGDKSPVRYYLQELPSASYGNPMPMPEKHFKFALAEIILEGVLSVTIEKTWDKYSCFRLHNLNSKPATVTFADGGYTVKLGPFQCATIRRDWNASTGRCTNYRPGFNYFFKYEGGDPRLYWFFPTTGGNIGFGGRAANSMQANNLVNAALLFDWLLFFQRTVDGTSTFAGWIEDVTVQCDIYPLLKNLFGDPSSNATLVGDLLHHRGDIVILRKPKKIYQLTHALVQNGGKGYAVGNILYPSGGTAIQPSQVQVSSVDGQGGIMSVAVSFGGGYVFPVGLPPSGFNVPSGGSGSGAVLNLQFNVVANNISGIYGTKDKVTFNGYGSLAADFAAKQLSVAENSAGDLVISNTDPYNDVYLFPISTNLFKNGETLPTYVDLTGTNQFTIENAIFESEPEQPYLDAFTLSSSAPSLLAQPVATTTVTAKVWYDIYDVRYLPAGIQNWDSTRVYHAGEWAIDPPANQMAFQALQQSQGVQPSSNGNLWLMVAQDLAPQYTANDWYYAPHPVLSAPQTTLNWNTGNYKLTGANVKDGGSAYAAGDGFTPDGGTGIPAQLEATAVAGGGRIMAVKIISPGGYSSPPSSPNAVVGGSGIGALINLTFANFPIFHGVHKKTVADLLTLDWWGDPAYPGQNSNWVAITNRKLTLTPQGLVLTFTETDSPLPGDSYSQPASLPTWASGKRGLPRNRQLRFRLHGWGYCGVASSGANPAIPPSGRTGIFSPTRGRQEAIGSYLGEFMAPSGADFSTDGWGYGEPTDIAMLTRIDPTKLQSDSRFWKLHGDGIWMFVYPPTTSHLDASGNQVVTAIIGTSGLPVMAMGLVVEMYNALARAVNSVTQGLPLMWQCLFFNVGGRIVSLDPQMGFGIGMGSSGCISPTGAFTGYQYNYYSGPRPMNQFCAFDQGSIYEKLCNQLGIMVRTEKDLPGGPEGGFGFYQGKTSAPAVYYDWAVASQNGDAGCTPAVDGVPWNDPSGNGYDKFSGTMTVTIGTELLSTAALLAGSPTGSKCLGTYDPVQYNAGNGPDFTNAPTGAFYVASDGSGNVATADGQRNVLGGAGLGQAYWTGGTVDLVNVFTSYRWITPDDMQRVVTSFGFPFLWREICTPLALRYFEDPTEQTTIADQSTITTSWKGTGLFTLNPAYGGSSGNIRIGTDHGYTDPDWETKEIQSINNLPPFTDFKFNNSGMPGHGTLIKFCVTNDQKTAQWKVGPVGAADASTLNAPTSVNGGYGLPVEILNIASRKGLSPIFRYKNAGWSISCVGYYLLGGGVYPTCFGCWSPGISASVDGESPMPNRPSTVGDFPQLAVQYTPKHGTAFSDLIAINYNEGSLLDQMECFAFNIYSSAPIAPIPVLLSGLASWRKQRDWWSNMDNAYAAVGYYNPNNQTVPWVFVPAPPSLSLQVSNYFNGGGQNGLTIIGAADDQRYACCFSMAATGIEL